MLSQRLPRLALACFLVLGLAGGAAAQKGPLEKAGQPSAEKGPLERVSKAAEAAKIEPLVIHMYNVQDLMLGRDFPYRSTVMPPTSLEPDMSGPAYGSAEAAAAAGGRGQLFGATEPAEDRSAASALTPNVLVDLIQRTVEPDSWIENGGRGKIDRVGALLVVTQTAENHKKIAELLEQFRTDRPMIGIEAKWMLLDDAQVALIVPEDAARRTVPIQVTAAALKEAKATVVYRAQVTCFDRQTTHMVSGQAQTLMANVTPVVAEAAVAWDPTISTMLWGALLEITPALTPGGNSVILKLHSSITEGSMRTKQVTSATPGGASGTKDGVSAATAKAEIELPEFLLHTFRTTVRAPLDKGILIGGMTSPKAIDGKVLYLFLQVSSSKDEEKAAPKGK
jgi:hypothetical protein